MLYIPLFTSFSGNVLRPYANPSLLHVWMNHCLGKERVKGQQNQAEAVQSDEANLGGIVLVPRNVLSV